MPCMLDRGGIGVKCDITWKKWYFRRCTGASQERSITGNHLKADNVQNCSLAMPICRKWFHRRIIHWYNASKRFIVLKLAFAVKSKIQKNDISTFKKRSWEPCEYVMPRWHQPRCLGPTSEQEPKSQHTSFDILCHRFKVNCKNSPVFQEHLVNAVLHYNSCHL